MTNFLGEIFFWLPSDSLFSTIITLYILVFLYFPSFSLQFIFSPVIFSTLILLLYLLRLGAVQKSTRARDGPGPAFDSAGKFEESVDRDQKPDLPAYEAGAEIGHRSCSEPEPDPNRECRRPFCVDSFVEWDVRAPLEIIYEEYDEEEDEEGAQSDTVREAKRESEMNVIRRYASLSMFYPESDSDASSEGSWGSPENACFRWEEDYDREGLIEIQLDGGKRSGEFDEENLIEIELFPVR